MKNKNISYYIQSGGICAYERTFGEIVREFLLSVRWLHLSVAEVYCGSEVYTFGMFEPSSRNNKSYLKAVKT